MTFYIPATFFSKTRLVKASFHNMEPGLDYDEVLWVERPEEMYALMSPELRDKKVAIVKRSDWLMAEESNL